MNIDLISIIVSTILVILTGVLNTFSSHIATMITKLNLNRVSSKELEKLHGDIPNSSAEVLTEKKIPKSGSHPNRAKTKQQPSQNQNTKELTQIYHEQALFQSQVQYWLSVITSVTGFILIIIILFSSRDLEWYERIIQTLPGAMIEIISVLFLSQAKEIRTNARDYFNNLQEEKRFDKSIELANEIEDEELKSLIKAKIALHICGIKDSDLISSRKNENKDKKGHAKKQNDSNESE